MVGCSSGLLTMKRKFNPQPHRQRGVAKYLLNDMKQSVQRAQLLSAKAPANSDLHNQARVLENWLEVARLANTRNSKSFLLQSWVDAVQNGEVAIQRWLSTASQLPPPRIHTRTDSEATSLLQFRSRIGQLDPRCHSLADEECNQSIRRLHGLMTRALKSGKCPPWIAASTAAQLEHSSVTAPLFVALPAVRSLISKRTANTSSSVLLWAAFKAAAAHNESLALVQTTLECTWACADMDDDALCIELTHLHKGKQKPVEQHSSYRPLGLAHPLTSLQADILRIRLCPGLACVGGTMQLGGLRDARLAVIGRQEAAARPAGS